MRGARVGSNGHKLRSGTTVRITGHIERDLIGQALDRRQGLADR